MSIFLFAAAEPSLGFVFLIVAVGMIPAIFGIIQAGRKREMEHKERLKALEMGLPVPGSAPWPALMAIAIGAVVPVGALAAALAATAIGPRAPTDHVALAAWTSQNQATAYYANVWGGATGVGVTAVIAGAVLAWRYMGLRQKSDRDRYAYGEPDYAAKPPFDPDAYDTVSQRG